MLGWLTTTTPPPEDKKDGENGDEKPAKPTPDQTCPLAYVADLVWTVSTFLDGQGVCRMATTCRYWYETMDDSVWKELCRRYIVRLPHQFASYRTYYRYRHLGEEVESGDRKSPFGTPIDSAVTLEGNHARIGVIGERCPVVRLEKTQKVSVMLVDRPEHCHVGITTDTSLKMLTRMWDRTHNCWAMSYMVPGVTLELEISGTIGHQIITVTRFGGHVDEIVLREPVPAHMQGESVYFFISMSANNASFAAIG